MLCALLLLLHSYVFNLELDTCASRARLVLQSCDFPAGAGTSTKLRFSSWSSKPVFAYYTCTSQLRSSSQSWKLVRHVLYLHYKVVTFRAGNLHTSRARLVLQSCDSPASYSWYYEVAIFQLELHACTLRTRLVLQSRNLPAGAGNLYFTYSTCTSKS